MSSELIVKIWKNQEVPCFELFLGAIKILEAFANTDLECQLFLKSPGLSKRPDSLTLPYAVNQIRKTLEKTGAADPSYHWTLQSSLPCWRPGQEKEKGNCVFFIDAWGAENLEARGADPRIEGDLQFSVALSPFVFGFDEEKTAENLEFLFEILLGLTEGLKPKSLKVFSEGFYQPMNAHLVYFNGPESLAEDLKTLQILWDRGFLSYGTPPLKSQGASDLVTFFRSTAEAEALFQELPSLMDRYNSEKPISVEKIDWTRFAPWKTNLGTFVLTYPFWTQHSLDHFYLELLNQS